MVAPDAPEDLLQISWSRSAASTHHQISDDPSPSDATRQIGAEAERDHDATDTAQKNGIGADT